MTITQFAYIFTGAAIVSLAFSFGAVGRVVKVGRVAFCIFAALAAGAHLLD